MFELRFMFELALALSCIHADQLPGAYWGEVCCGDLKLGGKRRG